MGQIKTPEKKLNRCAKKLWGNCTLTHRSYVHVCPITNKNTLDNDLIEFEQIKRVCTDRSQA